MPTNLRPRQSRTRVVRLRSVAVAVTTGLLVALSGPSGAAENSIVTLRVTGTIENVVVDSDAGQHTGATAVTPFVTVGGVLHALPDGTDVPAGPTGLEVVVTLQAAPGVSAGEALDLAAADVARPEASVIAVRPVTESTTGDNAVGAGMADTVAGTHTLTVLPVDWSTPDVSTGALTTLATATADYWGEQSAGRLTITTDVRAWATIPDPGSCSDAALTAIFNGALAANPYVATPSLTNHVLVYFPATGRCPFAGRASLLGGMIWVNGQPLVDVSAHELGHNLGLNHANTRACTSGGARVPLSGSCTDAEYADRADLMGIATAQRSGSINTALADSLGYAQVTVIPPTTSAPIIVDLSPLSVLSGMRAVKIQVPTGDVYIDFRPAAGRDVRMPAWAGVQVHLRTTDRWGIPTTYLLDMQSSTPTAYASPQMAVGATWVVPDTGLTVTVTSIGATARVQVASADVIGQYVTRVYRDLFNREPDSQGLATWTTALRAGEPRISVANSITYSAEYRSGLIQGAYTAFLGRTAEPAGLAGWLDQMGRGMPIQQMEGGFLASQEYYNGSGGNDAEWIRRLYSHVLARGAAQSEVDYWLPRAGSSSGRYGVAMGFLMSTERLTTVVDGNYVNLLDRHIDPSGRQTWVSQLQGGVRLEAVIGSIIASQEYYQRL